MGWGSTGWGSGAWGSGGGPPPPPPPLPPVPTPPAFALQTVEDFPLDMYRFIIFEIRRQDLLNGNLFLKRYLQGPNAVWENTVAQIQNIPELWDVEKTPDRLLKFLKNIVGWTNEPLQKKITDAITDDDLRRLISVSGALWKERGPETTTLNILRLLTRQRARIWNWFDFRWVLDETELGEEHQGRDPWIINLPSVVEAEVILDSGVKAVSSGGVTVTLNFGAFVSDVGGGNRFRVTSGPLNGQSALMLSRVNPITIILQGPGLGAPFGEATWEIVDESVVPDDENRSNLRISDDGTLDRLLLKRLLLLMRGVNERFEINYLLLLDLFDVDDDDLQWNQPAGANLTVSGGLLRLNDTSVVESTTALVTGAPAWSQIVFSARVRGTQTGTASWGLLFYAADFDDTYLVAVDLAAQTLKLDKRVATVQSNIATADLTALDFNILSDVFYTLRVETVVEGATNRIVVFVDGARIISAVDAELSQGSVGFFHTASATIEIDDAEVFQLPVDSETLGINETP